MISRNLIKALKSIPKTYFSVSDAEKFHSGKKNSLPVLLTRLAKRGEITRIMRGYYTFDIYSVDFEAFACEIKKPSYISLEYALYHHGLIDQIPETITLVTPGKSQVIECNGKVLEYSHLREDLYSGYEVVGNALIATKEKAVLDELYLIRWGKRSFSDFSVLSSTIP